VKTTRRLQQNGLLVACFLIAGQLRGQNTIGIPTIINYNKQAYGAGSQNWNIAQDKAGIMYFANNDGLLSFDGTFWRLYRLPNKTIARSVAVSADNKIYVGGQGEIGYFSPGSRGELVYTSLNPLVPAKDNDFADVWNICFFQHRVFFRANRKILEYNNQGIKVYNSPNWGFLGAVNGELLANENDKGLVSYINGKWLPRISTGHFPRENFMLRTALPLGKDSTLLVSLMHGLFLLHRDTLSVFETPDTRNIAAKNISAAGLVSAGRIALITNLAGCFIIDKNGKFIQRFTKREGIQNNNVLSVMMDKDNNLWLGLDNGIDLVTYNNAIKNIFPDQEDRNSGYTSAIYHDELYLGVSTGAYRIRLDTATKDLSYTNGVFEFIENSKGQVWSLASVNGKLLMGHNKGAYIVKENKAIPLDIKTGFWAFQPLYDNQPSPVIVAGTYNGISFYSYRDGIISDPVVYSQVESARFVAIRKNMIWIAHPYKGIYNISFDRTGATAASRYKDNKSILSSNHNKIFKLKDRVILTTDKGIFEYSEEQKDFVRSAWLEKLLGKMPVSYIREDGSGNIWFCRDRKVGVVDRSFKEPKIVLIPEIDGRIMAGGFENINVVDSNNVLIAAEKGFFHINYALYKKNRQALKVLIRRVQSTLQENGLIYGGHSALAATPSIKYRYNSLHFECSSTSFGQEQNIEYSYYLEGFDKDWSPWSKKTEKDYTNLPAGDYIIRVKCRNNSDNESPVSGFPFTVLPPWYQTWWAYGLYLVIFVSLIYLFYKRQQRKYKRLQQIKLQEQQHKYDEEQKQLQLQHQLAIQESEKQIIQLRNEKLESEVDHKNTELASSAMNLVRKKEMLSRLKEDLARYKNVPEPDKAAKEFQKIIRVIDKELDHNEEWEQFAMHFDSVHTNYLKKLKEYCPALSVSDLKLAAYLRLNLSTKEIAQLMTISIRGVETSRYRLRKKLGISNEMNLFDFLTRVTG
jgi:ligand-binding sensor domain-containing protein/DNA-binding CsgD family transcriptional regulator